MASTPIGGRRRTARQGDSLADEKLQGGATRDCRLRAARVHRVPQKVAQVTVFPGTDPSDVAELNEQLTVSTTLPGGCSTVTVPLVNATSVIVSVRHGSTWP